MYFVYILQSSAKKRNYIGITTDPERRLVAHNNGSTKSTRPFRPWSMIYKEVYEDKRTAYKREYYLKHPKGYKEKIEILNNISGEVA